MINRSRIFLGILLLLITACYPVSHILVGDKRAPIDPSDVKIYSEYPEKYDKIAIIEKLSKIVPSLMRFIQSLMLNHLNSVISLDKGFVSKYLLKRCDE